MNIGMLGICLFICSFHLDNLKFLPGKKVVSYNYDIVICCNY